MFRAQPVCSKYLDLAEKARAYERHTYALKHNPHKPISMKPNVAPIFQINRQRKDEEREIAIRNDIKNSRNIDSIWKKAHGIPIQEDFFKTQPKIQNRSATIPWSERLKYCEAEFPTENEKGISSNSSSLSNSRSDSPSRSQSSLRELESGMYVNYNSRQRSPGRRTPKSPQNEELIYDKRAASTQPPRDTPKPQRSRQGSRIYQKKPVIPDLEEQNSADNVETESRQMNGESNENLVSLNTFTNNLEKAMSPETDEEESDDGMLDKMIEGNNQQEEEDQNNNN